MHTVLRTVVRVVLLVAGLWLVSALAPSPASAAIPTDRPLVDLEVDLPIRVCATTVAVLGEASSSCGGAAPAPASAPSPPAAPTPAPAPPAVPAPLPAPPPLPVPAPAPSPSPIPVPAPSPIPVPGAPTGTAAPLVDVDLDVPVSICGTTVAVLGDATSTCAGSTGGSGGDASPSNPPSSGASSPIAVDADVPIHVCGTTVAVLGEASSSCSGPVRDQGPGIDLDGLVDLDLDVGLDLCGTTVALLGEADARCSDRSTDGIVVCGVTVAVLGEASTDCTGPTDRVEPNDPDGPGGPADGDGEVPPASGVRSPMAVASSGPSGGPGIGSGTLARTGGAPGAAAVLGLGLLLAGLALRRARSLVTA